MGLMDKFKNLFTDEEIIEEDDVYTVEIKEVKKQEEVNKLPTFMREKIEKEEKRNNLMFDVEETKEVLSTIQNDEDKNLPSLEEKKSFKFPIDITENDFVETRSRRSIHQTKLENEAVNETVMTSKPERRVQTEHPRVADLYKDKKVEKICEKKKFRATPIISPIYGVLDKNYTNGDIEQSSINNLEETRHSKSVDFDSVRKKAYGNLTQEIKENLMCENCEYLKEAKECKRNKERVQRQEYSYELLEPEENTYTDITLDEATENYYDYGVEYEKQIGSEIHQEEEVNISNFEEERPRREIPPVKSSINLLSTLKKSMGEPVEATPTKKEENLELTDDLFNLIDSMYDERNEN